MIFTGPEVLAVNLVAVLGLEQPDSTAISTFKNDFVAQQLPV
jgi:hypothetical protein